MTEFNTCAHLTEDLKVATDKYHQLKQNGESPLNYLLNLQNQLQIDLENRYPGRTIAPKNLKTKGELVDFLMDQKRAIDDEFQELVHSVAGTNKSDKDQTSIWKKWKSNYESLRSEGINEGLTEEEQLERAFEAIDIFHFWNNVLIALGLDEQKIFELYYLKNIENLRRYNNHY